MSMDNFYTLGEINSSSFILNLLLTKIRVTIKDINSSVLYQDGEIERQILRSIKKETEKWGVNVLNLKIDIII